MDANLTLPSHICRVELGLAFTFLRCYQSHLDLSQHFWAYCVIRYRIPPSLTLEMSSPQCEGVCWREIWLYNNI